MRGARCHAKRAQVNEKRPLYMANPSRLCASWPGHCCCRCWRCGAVPPTESKAPKRRPSAGGPLRCRAVLRLAPTELRRETARRHRKKKCMSLSSSGNGISTESQRNRNGIATKFHSAALLLIGSRASLPWSHSPFGTATHGPLLRQPIHHIPRNSLEGLCHALGIQTGVTW